MPRGWQFRRWIGKKRIPIVEPEMTGREYLQAIAVMHGCFGLDVPHATTGIAAFAEVTDFLDTPIRYYSSGMLSRIGVGLALATPAGLLLCDEALAVGDGAFRERCEAEIARLRAQGGALVLASQDASLLQRFCDRRVWIEGGGVLRGGPLPAVLDAYEAAHGRAPSPTP